MQGGNDATAGGADLCSRRHLDRNTAPPTGRKLNGGASLLAGLLVVFALLGFSPGNLVAGDLNDADRKRIVDIVPKIKAIIEENYYDPAIKGPKFDAAAELAMERVQKADSVGEAFAAIGQFVLDLNDSHTYFYPPKTRTQSDYGWTVAAVGSHIYVNSVDPKSDAARQHIGLGDELLAINGLTVTRQNLRRIQYVFRTLRPQPGLHLELKTPEGVARELDVAAQMRHLSNWVDFRDDEDKAEEALRAGSPVYTDEGAGVLLARIPSFLEPLAEMDDVLRRARGKESLIVDLRGNGGGLLETMTTLVGGMFSKDITVGTANERGKEVNIVAKGSGRHAFDGRLFVLVDSRSASAAELFARTMQLNNRGTVIGDVTAGEVMAARTMSLALDGRPVFYAVEVTVADMIMPDRQRLENVGVMPDFVVLPTAEDLRTGRDPVLDRALAFAHTPLYDSKTSAAPVK